MVSPEEVETARETIVRFRALLDIMHQSIEDGEIAYAQLFENIPTEEQESTKERQLQKMAAHDLANDPTALGKAIMQMRLDARDLAKAFDDLYHELMPK